MSNKLLDFLSTIPAEEKDIFLNLLEETESIDIAVRGTMLVLAISEPKLAKQLEGTVGDGFNINRPIKKRNDLGLVHTMVP